MRQTPSLRMVMNENSLWREVVWRHIVYLFFKPEERRDEQSIFFMSYIFPQSILNCLHGTVYG